MKYLIFLSALIVVIFYCSGTTVKRQRVVARDTTIKPRNAFTSLKLDSIAVARFLSATSVDDSVRNKMTSFYNARNYQYAWFTEDGLSEAGEAFWNLHQQQPEPVNDTISTSHFLHEAMQRLLNEANDSSIIDSISQIELNLSLHFFQYVKAASGGNIDPSDMQWYIPKRKLNASALLDSFLSGHGKNFRPLNNSFYSLREKIKRYGEVVKAGGWAPIKLSSKTVKKGQSDEAVVALKKRLKASGDFESNDTTNVFTVELAEAVKRARRSFGLKENEIVTLDLVEKLNVPAEKRMQQLLINLERMRWLPAWPANRLVANIPEYRLHVFENDKEILVMNIVVGKAANRTVIFSDDLQFIVFSPYWNVPESIVRNEILPAMNRSGSYLSRNNMEITGYSNGLPVVRQKPGPKNALGLVKFIFPNRYNIYFHDTPAKTLFNSESRAFSHGCVRIQEPFALAKYLLRNDSSWTEATITKAMNSSKEIWVKLQQRVPVYLLYLTAWVDKDGRLNFRDDVYGHDKRMAERLFTSEKTTN
jgi:murein L,D-transpeptidase YcbB/YkuD